MIDIQSEVFDRVFNALDASQFSVTMSSEHVPTLPSFPAVTLIESSNLPLLNSMTQQSRENHVKLMYEIDVYSSKSIGRKREAKKIAAIIDDIMTEMGFVRSLYSPVPNYADGSIFRLAMRYTAVANKEHKIYRG